MRSLALVPVVCFGAIAACAPGVHAGVAARRSEAFPLPEDEPAALEEMKALVAKGDIGTASWLAKSFRKLSDTDGVELLHARLWRQLAGELHQYTQYRKADIHHVRCRARVAAALGLHDVAIQCRREVLGKLGNARDRERANEANSAAMAAFRKRDFELAIEFFGLVEKYGLPGGQKEHGRKMAAHVRELARAPEDIETRIRFATEALARRPPFYRRLADAIALMRETLDRDRQPTLEERKKIYALIEDFHRQKKDYVGARDFAGAERWAMRAVEEFPNDKELCGAALVRVGADKYKQGDKARALALFRRAAEQCVGTKSWPDAQFNVGFILAELGKHKDAMAAFEKVLAAKVDNLARTRDIMAPLKNYQHRSCKQIALAYEALGNYGRALAYARLSKTKYRSMSFCGTCAKSESESGRKWETLLRALDALGKPTDERIARVAGEFMRRRNGHAKRVLLRLGPAAGHALVKVAGDKDAAVRRDALGVLLELGPDAAPAVPRLMELLRNDPERDIQFTAVICLGKIGAPARRAIPALLEGLAGKGSDVPQVALQALEAIGATKDVVPFLLAALEKGNRRVKGMVMRVIQGMGPKAADAVPALIRFGRDKKLRLFGYSEAPAALAAVGEAAVVPLLQMSGGIREGDTCSINLLSNTLRQLGPRAREAIPELIEMLGDRKLSGCAMEALASVGEAAVPALTELLGDEDESVRSCAAFALGEIGPAAAGAVPLLVQMAEGDEKKDARRSATTALGKLAPYAPAATPVLVKKLKSSDVGERYAAAKAFRKLWPGAMEALPALEGLASDTGHHWTRVAAQTAAGRLKAMQRIMARRAERARSE